MKTNLFSRVLFIFLIIRHGYSELNYICRVCHCDQNEDPRTVQCDSRNLTTLNNFYMNQSITTLVLTNNRFTTLSNEDTEQLNNMTSLSHLDLSNNSLTLLPALSAGNLTEMLLENTNLSSSYFPQSYKNSTQLQTINLSKNTIHHLNMDDFKFLTNLTNLSMNHAHINSINERIFLRQSRTLQSLSLIDNSLNSTRFLSMLDNIQWINLDYNNIIHFPSQIKHPEQVRYISIRYNKIHTIDEKSMLFVWLNANLTNTKIYLEGNPFDCCRSRWLIRYLNETQRMIMDVNNLMCSSPINYAGERLVNVKVDLMDCPQKPTDPSNDFVAKIIIIIFWLLCVIMILTILIGLLIHRTNFYHSDRQARRSYEPIESGNDPLSL